MHQAKTSYTQRIPGIFLKFFYWYCPVKFHLQYVCFTALYILFDVATTIYYLCSFFQDQMRCIKRSQQNWHMSRNNIRESVEYFTSAHSIVLCFHNSLGCFKFSVKYSKLPVVLSAQMRFLFEAICVQDYWSVE